MKQKQVSGLLLAGALLILSVGHPAAAVRQNHFSDVPPTHWAYDAVNELADLGILVGYPPASKMTAPANQHQSGKQSSARRAGRGTSPQRRSNSKKQLRARSSPGR